MYVRRVVISRDNVRFAIGNVPRVGSVYRI